MNLRKFSMILFAVFLLSGCDAVITMNGKVAGISSGKFLYQDGFLTSTYPTDIEVVWKACEKTVADLKASNIQKEKKISSGIIKSIIEDEKVIIQIEYVEKNLTAVSVSVGIVGNNMASHLIHDKILMNLKTLSAPPDHKKTSEDR